MSSIFLVSAARVNSTYTNLIHFSQNPPRYEKPYGSQKRRIDLTYCHWQPLVKYRIYQITQKLLDFIHPVKRYKRLSELYHKQLMLLFFVVCNHRIMYQIQSALYLLGQFGTMIDHCDYCGQY